MTSRPLLRKCFELSGIVPLGVYLVVHILSYARVIFGAVDFGAPAQGRAFPFLEIALVWAPLAFHVGYGFLLSFASTEDPGGDRMQRFWLRASGFASLAFIVAHGLEYRMPLLKGERAAEDVRAMLEASLSATLKGVPMMAALHIGGLSVVCLHFAIGVSRFTEGWGIFRKERARRFAMTLALLLFATGTTTIIDLATGSVLLRF